MKVSIVLANPISLCPCTLMMNQRFLHTFGSFTLAFWRYPEYAPCVSIDRHGKQS